MNTHMHTHMHRQTDHQASSLCEYTWDSRTITQSGDTAIKMFKQILKEWFCCKWKFASFTRPHIIPNPYCFLSSSLYDLQNSFVGKQIQMYVLFTGGFDVHHSTSAYLNLMLHAWHILKFLSVLHQLYRFGMRWWCVKYRFWVNHFY